MEESYNDIMKLHEQLLGDVSWFVRSGLSEVKRFTDPPQNIIEYIQKTRIDPTNAALTGEESESASDFVPYDMNEEIPLKSEYIRLSFQIDRYSELDPVQLTYKADVPVQRSKTFVNQEEFKEGAKQLLTEYGMTRSNEETLTVEYPTGQYTFSTGSLLNHIYRFYTSPISKKHLKLIAATDDGWGYSDKAKEALDVSTVLYHEEVMGDCMYFEGLRLLSYVEDDDVDIPTYQIMFGS